MRLTWWKKTSRGLQTADWDVDSFNKQPAQPQRLTHSHLATTELREAMHRLPLVIETALGFTTHRFFREVI